MRSPGTWSAWARRGMVPLGIVSALLVEAGSHARHALWAQDTSSTSARIAVRIRTAAKGTANSQAGEQVLDSLDALVYVSTQAVGARRVPLVVFPPGGGMTAKDEMAMNRPLAEKYGMILLTPNSGREEDISAAIEQVLRKFAVDPDRIAVAGMSVGGGTALMVGCNNLDVFSRIAVLSPVPPRNSCGEADPHAAQVQFFVAVGTGEGHNDVEQVLQGVRNLQRKGYSVRPVINTRLHQRRSQDHDYFWHWLQESWASPSATAQAAPPVAPDSSPMLTAEALTKLTNFWIGLMNEPDSIRIAGRIAYEREGAVSAGSWQIWINDVVDMPAFARRYPSVAAALMRAGLSAAQENEYRRAFLDAIVTRMAGDVAGSTAPTSILRKNVAFIRAHAQESVAAIDAIMGYSAEGLARNKEKAVADLKRVYGDYVNANSVGGFGPEAGDLQ